MSESYRLLAADIAGAQSLLVLDAILDAARWERQEGRLTQAELERLEGLSLARRRALEVRSPDPRKEGAALVAKAKAQRGGAK
jgi:hypothetical protein